MSRLSRYYLLISLVRSELKCQHNLGSDDSSKNHNDLLIQRSYEALIFLAEDLMVGNDCSEQARDTRLRNLLTVLNNHHISLILSSFKRCYDLLIDHISGKRCLQSYLDFKGRMIEDGGVPELGLLLGPIKESLTLVLQSQTVVSNGCFRNEATKHMWICAHYTQLLNKVNFINVGLEEKALQDYYSSEDETSKFDVSATSSFLPAIQKQIYEWFKDWNYDGSRPKHGPGSVADTSCDKLSKYYNLSLDGRLNYLYGDSISELMPFWHKQTFERCSKLVFVPKNITKLRSISMEPAVLQYFQQGCMESLYEFFTIQPELKHVLKLQDQTQNKSFAYHGSITNDYATIDLSHASDSVNWNLVKAAFKRVPRLLKWLICTRSTHTQLPDGVKIELTKFAPMGSALCFPIESILFAAIAKLSIALSKEQGDDRDVYTGIRDSHLRYSVYGDDIIIPSYAGDRCISLLKTFGFTPNNEKSYLNGPFKESCGGNYFCGYDITPLKYAPDFSLSHRMGVSPQAYTALCAYANLAYVRGLYSLRHYIIKLIFESGCSPLFSDRLDDANAIFSVTPTNFHLKKIYRKRYQKHQYVYTGTKAVSLEPAVCHMDEDIYYFDRLLELSKRKEDCHLPLINARLSRNQLLFDVESPYARSSLLQHELMYTLCSSDV